METLTGRTHDLDSGANWVCLGFDIVVDHGERDSEGRRLKSVDIEQVGDRIVDTLGRVLREAATIRGIVDGVLTVDQAPGR